MENSQIFLENAWQRCATKHSRPDCETAMSFLMTHVHFLPNSSKDDWHKLLLRMMSFIKETVINMQTIGGENVHHMLTMVDSTHAVHNDMRGHTGGLMTFGTEVVHQKSSKQKMNTRSSTEHEHVRTSEYNDYFEMFMEGQGFKKSKEKSAGGRGKQISECSRYWCTIV